MGIDNNEKTKGKSKKTLLKLVTLKIIPMIIGLMIWTDVKNIFMSYMENSSLHSVYEYFNNSNRLFLILLFVSLVYGLLIRAFSNWGSAIWFWIKIYFVFPIYLICQFLYYLYIIFKTLFIVLNRIHKFLSMPIVGVLLIVTQILLYYFFWSIDHVIISKVSIYIFPLISLLMILWLYIWTFYPFKSFEKLSGLIDWYIAIKVNPITNGNKKFSVSDNLLANVPDEKLDEFIKTCEKESKFINRFVEKIESIKVEPLLVNIFIILFLLVSTLVCLNFAFCYSNLYANYSEFFTVKSNVSFFDFVMLSFRTLFFNDYSRIIPIAKYVYSIILIESLYGISLFILLIMSFSAITAKQGHNSIESIVSIIKKRVDSLESYTYEYEVGGEVAITYEDNDIE